jgi:hypothetical protein
MGLRLDWEIESEKGGSYSAQEDPQLKRRRRQGRRRLILLLIGVVTLLAGAGALLIWRLTAADLAIESQLRDTVEAEVAALRIGDWNAFNAAQRSADPTWGPSQQNLFTQYQQFKEARDINLTGTVRALTIDGLRARVVVEEIIEGIPYAQAWFYWRYDDGWLHGPQDIAFWGARQAYTGRDVTVRYLELDEPLARDLGVAVESWVNATCGPILQCGDLPHITLNIDPSGPLQPAWNAENPWTLDLLSPFAGQPTAQQPLAGRVRYDQPFSGQLRLDVAGMIAARVLDEATRGADAPSYPSDAAYLRASIIAWLTGRYAGVANSALLITSLAENYGLGAVGRLAPVLTSGATLDVLAGVTGVPLEAANLDWRDLLSWRLQLEHALYLSRDQAALLNLYDVPFHSTAAARFGAPTPPPAEAEVVLAPRSTAPDGVPQIVAIARFGTGEALREEQVTFRWVGGAWRRAS